MNKDTPPPGSPVVGLLRDLRNETATLIDKELELARTEISEKIDDLANHAIQVGVGAAVAYAGLIILLFGLADLIATILIRSGMESSMATWISRAGFGFLVAVIGGLMALRAKNALAAKNLKPQQTIDTLQEDKDWAQDKLQHST